MAVGDQLRPSPADFPTVSLGGIAMGYGLDDWGSIPSGIGIDGRKRDK